MRICDVPPLPDDRLIPAAEAGASLTIDLGAIAANWRALASRADGAECAAAVKADAYGTGIETTVPALAEAGCRTFFVAQLPEARRVRSVAPDATIYVLNGLPPGTAEAFARHALRPVLGSPEEIREWCAFESATAWTGGAAIHVDTGMTRLGLEMKEVGQLDARPRTLSLLMSHFACADEPDHPLNARQIEAFAAARHHFPGVPASLCNSSGLFLAGDLGLDLVRPGIALYGGNPTPGRENPMRPVVALEAPILRVRQAAAGETVGYGATYRFSRASRVAVVGIGYADGLLRAGSSPGPFEGAEMAIRGRRCRVVGRISMDLTALDVTDIPGEIERWDKVEVIGPTVPLDEVARRTGTVAYEVLTSLGERYHRRLIG
jgi:alanine racemase